MSASATTHLARATASFGPKARAALRTRAFARTRSPSCAIATFPWASSFGSDFNSDFNVSVTEEQQREGSVEYNYRRARPPFDAKAEAAAEAPFAAMVGTDVATYTRERPGMSAFVLEDGVVYHTYATYARGLDGLWGMYQWLDRAPKGRNETSAWWRHHDEYDSK
jgi:predicted dithiol-disulfide oxidoreductase (DUF899 family)